MGVEQELMERLKTAFQPEVLEVRNDSHRHHGHAGDDGSGESHFHVVIRAAALADLGRVARHRAVHAAIGDLNTRIHALGIDAG